MSVVTAVSRSARHSFSKPTQLVIRLIAGLGAWTLLTAALA